MFLDITANKQNYRKGFLDMIINCKTETIRVSDISDRDRITLSTAGYKNTEQVGIKDNEIWVRRTDAAKQAKIAL